MDHRLYVFTGKGGVGKTSISLAFAKQQLSSGKKILYTSIDQKNNLQLCEQLDIPFLNLNSNESLELYISKKFKSKFIASWIVRAPFFKSLFQMIPSLENIIFLGHLIQYLKDDPKLTIILDSPSSGHALAIFEAAYHFKDIFLNGLLVEDLNNTIAFLEDKKNIKIIIPSIPTKMSMNETFELKESLEKLNSTFEINIILNYLFSKVVQPDQVDSSPRYLVHKINIENEIIKTTKDEISSCLPFICANHQIEVIKSIYRLGVLK